MSSSNCPLAAWATPTWPTARSLVAGPGLTGGGEGELGGTLTLALPSLGLNNHCLPDESDGR